MTTCPLAKVPSWYPNMTLCPPPPLYNDPMLVSQTLHWVSAFCVPHVAALPPASVTDSMMPSQDPYTASGSCQVTVTDSHDSLFNDSMLPSLKPYVGWHLYFDLCNCLSYWFQVIFYLYMASIFCTVWLCPTFLITDPKLPFHCPCASSTFCPTLLCVLHLTVYPKKYAHGFVVLCFVVVMQSFIMNSHEVFIHIQQGCFAGTGAIVRLPQCQWSKPDGYGKISQCITTTKHSKAKTVCIFLGIYCSYWFHALFSHEQCLTGVTALLFINLIQATLTRCLLWMTAWPYSLFARSQLSSTLTHCLRGAMAEWLRYRTQGCGLHVALWPGVRIPVLPRVICNVALSRRLSSGGWLQST